LTPEDLQEGAALTLPDPRVGIFVFPEGSRSRDGAVHRFRLGAFVLAKHLDVPVVPVVVAGSRLGIRPGSLWIHPTRVHSRVLPPMRPLPEENHRQFAARVRAAVEHEHHRLLTELLKAGHLNRHRRHRSVGLMAPLRRAIRDEEASGAWRLLLDLPRQEGEWLFVGCGWSTLPLTVRQLYAEATIHLVENDEQHVIVARHQWVQDGDHVVTDVGLLPSLPRVTVVVCCLPADYPRRLEILEQVTRAEAVTTVLIAGSCELLTGYVRTPTNFPGWSLLQRNSSAAD
jgi:hypothetical protein